MKLNFFLDKSHFPEAIPQNLDDPVIKNVDNRNTWYAWTIKTYIYLKEIYACELTSVLPQAGVILYFRGSISLDIKPNKRQFFICMVGDSSWHPYANINVFQNFYQAKLFENGVFMQHWLLNNIIVNTKPFQKEKLTITHFGDPVNMDIYFRSDQWMSDVKTLGFEWIEKPNSEWNNYENVDIILAVRSFDSEKRLYNKPASKLINAWHGGVVPILGKESAYQAYKSTEYDYLEVDSIDALKKVLTRLKTDTDLVKTILSQGHKRAMEVNNDIIKGEWISFIENIAFPEASRWFKKSLFLRTMFVLKRFIIYRSSALLNRVIPGVWLGSK